MIQGIEIPLLNPIALRVEGEFEGYAKEWLQASYMQPFQPGDTTKLQLLSDVPFQSVSAQLVNRYGLAVKSLAVRYPDTTIANVFAAELSVPFAGLPERVYRIVALVKADNTAYSLSSRCLRVQERVTRSVWLQYSNTENAHNTIFFPGLRFGLRLEGGFVPKAYTPESDDTVYRDEELRFVLLHATPYETFRFFAGGATGIPDWLHSIANRAFACDTLAIDGTLMAKVESAKWEASEEAGYDLRSWSITLAKAVNEAAYTPKGMAFSTYSCAYATPVCQLVTQTFSVTVVSDDLNRGTVSGGGTVEAGGSVPIAAYPKAGYDFYVWKVNGAIDSSLPQQTSFTPVADATLTAAFSLREYGCDYTNPICQLINA